MTYLDTHPGFAMAVDAYPLHARLKSGADHASRIALPWARRDFRPTFAKRQTPKSSPPVSANARRSILRRLGPRETLIPDRLTRIVYKPRIGGVARQPAPNRPRILAGVFARRDCDARLRVQSAQRKERNSTAK